jgi:hypothetical protein
MLALRQHASLQLGGKSRVGCPKRLTGMNSLVKPPDKSYLRAVSHNQNSISHQITILDSKHTENDHYQIYQ